jgi:hypothetical protein
MARVAGREAVTRAEAFRLASSGLFLVSVFYGYVWIGITLPLSMLVLPLVFIAHLDRDVATDVPRGALLLLGMTLPIGLQAAAGRPLEGKPDAVVFLSVAYAVATVIALRRVELSDKQLRSSLQIGGLVTCAVMLATIAFLPAGRFLVPGQDALRTQRLYREALKERAKETLPPDGVTDTDDDDAADALRKFDRQATAEEEALYQDKAVMRSALGRSNTIAWYLVFLFSVCFFAGSWWLSALFAAVALATLTRFAVLFLVGIVAMRIAWRRGVGLWTLAACSLAVGVAGMAAILVLKHAQVVLPISLDARAWYWNSALDVIANHPLIGTPRSDILETFDVSIVWTPCNGFLWVVAVTGVVGAAFYFGFVWVALAEIRRMAMTSQLWAGLFVGFVTLLTWSLFEPISLTPTFDVLLAAHYAVARRARRTSGFGE